MNHYPHHIGDFNNATRHLTRVERSLYRDLIELYYDTEQPLNADVSKLARRVLAVSDDEREALNSVLEEFFTLQDDGWHNTRCNAEIAKYQGQIEQASRAGKASAAKRYGRNLTSVEQPFNQPEPEPEPEPEPITKEEKKKKSASAPTIPEISDSLMADFLQVRKAKKAPLTETAMDGIRREAGKAGITLTEAITVCIENSWQGFRADWYAERQTRNPAGGTLNKQQALEASNNAIAAKFIKEMNYAPQ